MLSWASMSAIGYLGKPHGFKGCLKFETRTPLETSMFIFLSMDDCPIPFKIKNINNGGSTLCLEDIETEEKAKELSGKQIWQLTSKLPTDVEESQFVDFLNYQCFNCSNLVGEVVDVLNHTHQKILRVMQANGEESLVPFVEEFLVDIDHQTQRIWFELPDGLLGINEKNAD